MQLVKPVELDKAFVVEMYGEGFSAEEIAQLAGCSRTPVYKVLRNPELNPAGIRQRKVIFDEAELVRLYGSGMGGEAAMIAVGAPITAGWDVLRDEAKNPGGIRREASVARQFTMKSGRTKNVDGYVLIHMKPGDEFYEMANGRGWLLEHRLAMARHLGRPLAKDENVHHINGIRDDNRIENLELWMTKQPKGIRGSDRHCLTCTCGTED